MIEDTRALTHARRELLDGTGELAPIREAYQKLEAMTFTIAEKMYGGSA